MTVTKKPLPFVKIMEVASPLEKRLADLETENRELKAAIEKRNAPEVADEIPMPELVAKAESMFMKQAENAYAAKRQEFDEYVARHASERGLDVSQAGADLYKSNDAGYLAAANAMANARRYLDQLPHEIVEKAYAPKVEALRKSLDEQAERYAMAHKIKRAEAASYLLENSSQYQKTYAEFRDTQREMGVTAATMTAKREQGQANASEMAKIEARAQRIQAEPIALKKFRIGCATFAQKIGKSEAAATEEYLRTSEGADLYAGVRAEQIARGQ